MNDRDVTILLVEDEPALLGVLELGLLVDDAVSVISTQSAEEAQRLMGERAFDLIVTDYRLGDGQPSGLELMERAQSLARPPLVILMTAFSSMQLTLDAIRAGAYDFLAKPFQIEEMQLVVRNALDKVRQGRRVESLENEVEAMHATLAELELRQRELLTQFDEALSAMNRAPGMAEMALVTSVNAGFANDRQRYQDRLREYIRQSDKLAGELRLRQSRLEDLRGPLQPNEILAGSDPARADLDGGGG